jgi:predicted nucleic acid-binding protein
VGFVVDANVCAKWFFEEEHGAEAARVLEARGPLRAPDLIVSELGSITWKKCARGDVTAEYGARVLQEFGRSGLVLTAAAELAEDALSISLALRHSFYDCLYLALARKEHLTLVTADRRLHGKLPGSPFAGLTLWVADVP